MSKFGWHRFFTPRSLRAVRTQRYKYIRSYKLDQPRGVDRGPAQEFWEKHGYQDMRFPDEALYDLVFDPHEANNLAESRCHSEILKDMRTRLRDWMASIGDSLAEGVIPVPPVKRNELDAGDALLRA